MKDFQLLMINFVLDPRSFLLAKKEKEEILPLPPLFGILYLYLDLKQKYY
jgi:hypothetical protein